MKILLTGSTGLVGRNLIESIHSKKYELLTPSHAELDLLDQFAVLNYLEKNQPDLIIHAAGVVGGIASNVKQPLNFLINNIDMGRNIIYGAYQTGINNFINISSTSIYPKNIEENLSEEMIFEGKLDSSNEGYALAKYVCTRMCIYINRENTSFHYKTLIPCNLYGRWDKFIGDSAHMIPSVINRVYEASLNKKNVVEIWGEGNVRREFMYAGDLANCIWYCVENFDFMPELMNVGLGYDYTINQYYENIAKIIGFNGKFAHDLTKPEGTKRRLTNISKMLNFGWKPKINLQDGLKRTFSFYLKYIRRENNG